MQSCSADRVVLWLAEDQFDQGIASLPSNLAGLIEHGLEIRFVDDLKSHKKYYWAMLENPCSAIVLVDDDVIYPENMIENLLVASNNYPGCICCSRGRRISFSNSGRVELYSFWSAVVGGKGPDLKICATGVGGVLYPPSSVDDEVFNIESILDTCLYADDLWLKVMSLVKGTSVVCVGEYAFDFFDTCVSAGRGLSAHNVILNGNDHQLHSILNRYSLDMHVLCSSGSL